MAEDILPLIVLPVWFGDMSDDSDREPNASIAFSVLDVLSTPSDDTPDLEGSVQFSFEEFRGECKSFFTGKQVRDWYEELRHLHAGETEVCYFEDVEYQWKLSFSSPGRGGLLIAGELAISGLLRPKFFLTDVEHPKSLPSRIRQRGKHSPQFAGVRVLFSNGFIDEEHVGKMLRNIAGWLVKIGC